MPTYDHNIKAGNKGDIVKHTALIAALDSVVQQCNAPRFRYIDVYGGYASNPILSRNEWVEGVGKIHSHAHKVKNTDVKKYYEWYLSRPNLIGGIYPGSSLIAYDVITNTKIKPHITIHDISDKVIQNLDMAYTDVDGIRIIKNSADPEDDGVQNADFIFIDPPGLYSAHNPSYPTIDEILETSSHNNQLAILIWIPVTISTATTPPSISKTTKESMDALLNAGYNISRFLWANGGRTVGCFLAYKLPSDATQRLQAATSEIANIAGWQSTLGESVTHISPS